MAESQEPSLLNYARFHGIAIDHQAINPLDQVPQPHESIQNTLADPPDAPILHPSQFHSTLEKELQSERLEIPKDAARFLSSVIQSASAKALDIDWDSFLPDSGRIRNLKLKLPLLKRDFGLDTVPIGTEHIALDPVKLHLPREDVDAERDEGLAFPKRYVDLADRIWNEATTEKLDCSREDLELLQNTRRMKEPDTAYIIEDICERELGIKGKYQRNLSSNLLQRTDFGSDIYSSQTPSLPLVSGPDPDTDADLTVTESKLEAIDMANTFSSEKRVLDTAINEPADESSDTCSGQITNVNSTENSDFQFGEDPGERICIDISQEPGQNDEETDYSFPALRNNVEGMHSESLPSEPNTAGEMLDDYTLEVACSSFEVIEAQMGKIQHLIDGNATASLSYSKSSPVAPARDISRSKVSEDTNTVVTPTIKQSTNKIKTLNPDKEKLCNVSISESQAAWLTEGSLTAVMATDNTIVDNDRVEGIIEVASTDTISAEKSIEEVVPLEGIPNIEASPDSIVSKGLESHPSPSASGQVDSDFEYVEEKDKDVLVTGNNKTKTKKKILKQKLQKLQRPTKQKSHRSEEVGTFLCSSFSALGSLSSFMEIRGAIPKRQKIEQSPYFSIEPQKSRPVFDSEPTEVDRENCEPSNEHGKVYITFSETEHPAPQGLPQVIHPLTLVLSTGLLRTHRDVITSLETLTPAPVLIFRDYETPMSSKSSIYNSNGSGFACEADIIISQTTGIILTTTQATTQLYLPGHKPQSNFDGFPSFHSPLQERIARLSLRYDRIYILICHASSASNGPNTNTKSFTITIDPRTLSSVQSLTAFCASLATHSTIVPLLVPSSQHNILQWVITLANKHAYTPQDLEKNIKFTPINPPKNETIVQSIHDETPCELFLRRAGLNPFAAVAVLDCINRREIVANSDASNIENHGLQDLPTFIEMDPSLRRQLFIPIIGTRALDRLESTIEREWQLEEWGLGF